jgi:hypothetical protein
MLEEQRQFYGSIIPNTAIVASEVEVYTYKALRWLAMNSINFRLKERTTL